MTNAATAGIRVHMEFKAIIMPATARRFPA
jgi:hypothetical protein